MVYNSACVFTFFIFNVIFFTFSQGIRFELRVNPSPFIVHRPVDINCTFPPRTAANVSSLVSIKITKLNGGETALAYISSFAPTQASGFSLGPNTTVKGYIDQDMGSYLAISSHDPETTLSGQYRCYAQVYTIAGGYSTLSTGSNISDTFLPTKPPVNHTIFGAGAQYLGHVHGSDYYISTGNGSFYMAEELCIVTVNAHLLEINSPSEYRAVIGLLRNITNKFVWIGASDEEVEGKWVSIQSSNQPVYMKWYTTEPDGGTKQNCAYMSSFLGWLMGDADCSLSFYYICELDNTKS